MEKLSIRILKPNELSVLTELFTYNDVSEMITSNIKKMENGDSIVTYEVKK